MVCISLAIPVPVIPSLPNLNVNDIVIKFPPAPLSVGIPCCTLTLPSFYIPIPISAILAPFLTAIQAMNAIIAALNAAIQIYIKSLPALYLPNCPFDVSVSV
jgi:hypothetical protein